MKEYQILKYKEIMNKKTNKQLQKECYSLRRYFDTHSQMYTWGNFNPNDFNNSDRLIILRDLMKERGIKE